MSEDQMQQGNVVCGFFLPPHQDAPEAVHPRVDALDDPPSRAMSVATLPLLLAARADVRRISAATRLAAHRVRVVGFIRTKMVLASASRSWSGNRNAIERFLDQTPVMHVGAGNRQTD